MILTHCSDATSGKSVWNYTTTNTIVSTSAVAAGLVYFGDYDSYIYCLNGTIGTLLWRTPTGNAITGFAHCGRWLCLYW